MKKLFLIFILFLSCFTFIFSYEETIDVKVEKILSQMTLEEKIGQMTQVDSSYIRDPEDIRKYFIGSVLSGGNSGSSNPI